MITILQSNISFGTIDSMKWSILELDDVSGNNSTSFSFSLPDYGVYTVQLVVTNVLETKKENYTIAVLSNVTGLYFIK